MTKQEIVDEIFRLTGQQLNPDDYLLTELQDMLAAIQYGFEEIYVRLTEASPVGTVQIGPRRVTTSWGKLTRNEFAQHQQEFGLIEMTPEDGAAAEALDPDNLGNDAGGGLEDVENPDLLPPPSDEQLPPGDFETPPPASTDELPDDAGWLGASEEQINYEDEPPPPPPDDGGPYLSVRLTEASPVGSFNIGNRTVTRLGGYLTQAEFDAFKEEFGIEEVPA